MQLQYAKFTSLILPFFGLGRIPSYPFDVNNGVSQDELHNVFYHFYPAVTVQQFTNIGYAISHYADDDSRWVCCMTCSDDVLGQSPDILTDAVEMGMSAWGGKCMIPEDALRLARYLQPARQYTQVRMNPEGANQTWLVTVPEIILNTDGILSRADSTEEVVA